MDTTKAQERIAVYNKYKNVYPYATEAIMYYYYGDTDHDNMLRKAYRGDYGRGSIVDAEQVSRFMLDMECSWEECIEEINDFIKNLPTQNDSILSDYY